MNNATSYEEQKRSEEELEQLRIAAESGDKNAMCEYGKELADSGKYDEAFRWLAMSKDLNDPDAWVFLGLCYLYGKGTDKNIEEAINCLLRAAELGGIGGATYIYLISHKYDDYVNFDEVVRIFEQLNNNLPTEYVDVEAISLLKLLLACCYYWGVGAEQDKEHAKQLLLSVDYDFDEDKTPLLIKESTLAFPFPKKVPFCDEFLFPLIESYFDLRVFSSFSMHVPTLKQYNLAKYSKTKELYNYFKKLDDKDLDFYLEAVSEDNANYMRDALEEDNYPDFRNACLKEPNFTGCVLLFNKLEKYIHFSADPLSFDIDYEDSNINERESFDKNHKDVKTIKKLEKFNCNFFYNKEISTQIRLINLYTTSCIVFSYELTQIICDNADNMPVSVYEFYNKLTKLLNQPKFSEEIYEIKKECINTPEILDWLGRTKEQISSILGIVEENTEESPDNKIETINAKDIPNHDTYKCITFDGCEEAYKKFFEKLKEIDYIDESTSFEIFKVAIGLEPAPEEGFFPRVIWKPVYRSGPYWRPLLNMLRLIGIKREDIKPKIINSLFVHPTGKKIDSNVIKVHKATKEVSFNGEKPISIHKHLYEFLKKSGFPSDKLIHNLD